MRTKQINLTIEKNHVPTLASFDELCEVNGLKRSKALMQLVKAHLDGIEPVIEKPLIEKQTDFYVVSKSEAEQSMSPRALGELRIIANREVIK